MKKQSELKTLASAWVRSLNKVVLNWELIQGCSSDEFDSLTHKLIGHLTKGGEKEKIRNILESELVMRYGLSPTEVELEQFTIAVVEWWSREKMTMV
jgi:hypothetical protein